MYYIVESEKAFDRAASDLADAVVAHGFGVLHIHDMGESLRSKGIEFAEECRIFEVCQPQQATKVLAADMRLNMALPCRISVYTQDGTTRIGMIKPRGILTALSDDPALGEVAREVEAKIIEMIEDAR
jgi:uncharacterized protein (DUF302 family)